MASREKLCGLSVDVGWTVSRAQRERQIQSSRERCGQAGNPDKILGRIGEPRGNGSKATNEGGAFLQ
jgi:hypothetical protein